MATSAAPGSDRTHAAAKRYIYAWGGGRAEGDATMRDLLGGKGAGLAEMTNAGLPVAARLHDHDRSVQRLLRERPAAPRRAVGGRPRGRQAGRGRDRQGLRRRGEPAPRERPLRREVLDARDDGHGPQPRPERGHAAGPRRAHRQRAFRLGRLPAVHPDVRADRDGRARRAIRPRARREEGRPRRLAGHRPQRRGPARGRRRVPLDRPRGHRPRLPGGPVRAARPRDQGRLRVVVRQARDGLPQQPEDRARPRHRGERRDDGLREHGRRLGHRRRVHPRSEHRREAALRRVPHQCPGRGRRGRHPDGAEDLADADRHAGGLRGVPAHRPAARAPLPRRPGPRVHDRARPAVHAPDALGQADRGRGRADRRRHGRGRPHLEGGGSGADRAGPRRPAPARHVRPGRAQGRHQDRERAQRLAGRGRRAGRVRRRYGRRMGRPRREGHPRSHRDVPGRLPRHGRLAGHHHRPRRRHLARGGRRPPDRQAVRRRVERPDGRLRAASRRTAT